MNSQNLRQPNCERGLRIGLKPVQRKDKMLEILQGISDFISPESLLALKGFDLQQCVFDKLELLINRISFGMIEY